MRLRYTSDALKHIDQIHDYISPHNRTAATESIARIRASAERLLRFPHIGRMGLVPGTLEWVVRGLPYVIVYEVDADLEEIVILGVFHGAQDRENPTV